MNAQSLIAEYVPAARLADTAQRVLAWMDDNHLAHIPVVENGELMGLVSQHDLLDLDDANLPLTQAKLMLADGSFVLANQHAYDALSLMQATSLTVIPVLSLEHAYQGVITGQELLKYLASNTASTEPGGIIELEVPHNDYHLRELASIVESNGANILSAHTRPGSQERSLRVTLKLNRSELTPILLAFERYGYTVADTFFDKVQLDDSRNRYEALLRYLEV